MEGFLTESHIVVVGDDPNGLREVEQVLHTDGYRRISLTTDALRRATSPIWCFWILLRRTFGALSWCIASVAKLRPILSCPS